MTVAASIWTVCRPGAAPEVAICETTGEARRLAEHYADLAGGPAWLVEHGGRRVVACPAPGAAGVLWSGGRLYIGRRPGRRPVDRATAEALVREGLAGRRGVQDT